MKPGLLSKTPRVQVRTLDGRPVRFPGQNPNMLPYPALSIEADHINTDTSRMIEEARADNADLRTKVAQLEELLHQEIDRRAGVDPEGS